MEQRANPQAGAVRASPVLDRSTLERGTGAVICMKQELGALPGATLYLPAWAL